MNIRNVTILIAVFVVLASSACLPVESTAVPVDATARIDRGIGVMKDTLSPSGTLLATGGVDYVTIWDAQTLHLLRTLRGPSGEIWDVGWSQDSSRLISAGEDKTVYLWDVNSDSPPILLGSHPTFVYSVALSPDDGLAASGDMDGTIIIWDVASHTSVLTIPAHHGGVDKLAWSPDGALLASGGYDNTIKLWDLTNPPTPRILRGTVSCPSDPCRRTLKWAPDGLRILSGSWDQSVTIWDASTAEILMKTRMRDRVSEVAWSPDGHHVAIDQDNEVLVLDASSGKVLHTFSSHPNYWITSVSWAPLDNALISGDHIGTLIVWDLSKILWNE
jgi:WD40 repeat protein